MFLSIFHLIDKKYFKDEALSKALSTEEIGVSAKASTKNPKAA